MPDKVALEVENNQLRAELERTKERAERAERREVALREALGTIVEMQPYLATNVPEACNMAKQALAYNGEQEENE